MSDSAAQLRAAGAALAQLDLSKRQALIDAMALIYEAVAGLPDRLLQDYEGFAPSDLADGDGLIAAGLLVGRAALPATDDNLALLLHASRLLRMLEQTVMQFERSGEGPFGPTLEESSATSDGKHFVIPRSASLPDIKGKPFSRRALRHYRVIPTRIDEFDVRLHRPEALSDAATSGRAKAGEDRSYGAALFPGLEVTTAAHGDDAFLVTGVGGFDVTECLIEQLDEAQKAGSTAIVWAELTMPDAHIDILQRLIERSALDALAAREFFVAGSWHRENVAGMQNICIVLDGYGNPLFEVPKWAKFKLGTSREAIVPGHEIHLLIGEHEIILIAICRDFLQETKETAYRRLDVDIAIVPSMMPVSTDKKTLSGHAAAAQTMRVRFGTRTLVVAQPAKPGDGPVGKVLAFPAEPLEAKDGEAVDGAWHLCILESVNQT
jgi:hypothetical protein